MKIIGKKFDYNHGLEMAKNCKKQGIRTQACFVIGHPNERIKDFFLSLKYMIRLTINGLDEIAVFIISPFSGSKLSVQIENKKKMLFTLFLLVLEKVTSNLLFIDL